MTFTCAHCGQPCGDYAGGFAAITRDSGTVYLCHPNDLSRPDCYRRVTVWREPPGGLKGVSPLPAGVAGVDAPTDAFLELVALSEKLGLYADE